MVAAARPAIDGDVSFSGHRVIARPCQRSSGHLARRQPTGAGTTTCSLQRTVLVSGRWWTSLRLLPVLRGSRGDRCGKTSTKIRPNPPDRARAAHWSVPWKSGGRVRVSRSRPAAKPRRQSPKLDGTVPMRAAAWAPQPTDHRVHLRNALSKGSASPRAISFQARTRRSPFSQLRHGQAHALGQRESRHRPDSSMARASATSERPGNIPVAFTGAMCRRDGQPWWRHHTKGPLVSR